MTPQQEQNMRVLEYVYDQDQDQGSAGPAGLSALRELVGVACHEHGTAVAGFLPTSWDHLDCQSWDHPARLAVSSFVCSLTHRVLFVDVEVSSIGIQGGRRG